MYKLKEVVTPSDENLFIDLPATLYRNSNYWVHPLNGDIRSVFDKSKNPLFKSGELCRWILLNDNGECIGRVAAFINNNTYNLGDYKVGQMGFFECINNQEAAFTLFDCCKEWLIERGMDAIEGPVNFGERMEWWGLLHDGFDEYPVYAMPYTHKYYITLFEEYGFKNYYNQYCYRTKLVEESLSKVVVWKADRILRDSHYRVVTFEEIGKKAAIEAIYSVYNRAWNLEVHGVKGVSKEEIIQLYKSLKPVIDKQLIYFAFYNDEPIGFFLMFPEMNQVFKKMHGKVNFWGALKLLYSVKFHKIDVALGQLFGVVPEFQNKGVEAALIKQFYDNIVVQKSPYKYLELNWEGDFNPPMVHLMDYIGGKRVRTHVTYRLILNKDYTFERAVDRMKRLKQA